MTPCHIAPVEVSGQTFDRLCSSHLAVERSPQLAELSVDVLFDLSELLDTRSRDRRIKPLPDWVLADLECVLVIHQCSRSMAAMVTLDPRVRMDDRAAKTLWAGRSVRTRAALAGFAYMLK